MAVWDDDIYDQPSGFRERLSSVERPLDGRMAGGVCAGLSQSFNVDVAMLRFAFLVLGLAKGVGVLVYLILWLGLPGEGEAGQAQGFTGVFRDNFQRATQIVTGGAQTAWDRVNTPGAWSGRSGLGLGLIVVGVLVLAWSFGLFSWLTLPRALGIGAVAVGVGMLVRLGGKAGGNDEETYE